jgi:uncharacterized protein (TIGR00730 family)
MKVCVFAASSSRIANDFFFAASKLGVLLAEAKMDVIFGGGGIGLMGFLADAFMEKGGRITGIIPEFMKIEGWGHSKVMDMVITSDMSERKRRMFEAADAVVALPGGIGTLEELTEAITLKQLGLFKGPVIILNTLNYYRPLIDFFEQMITDHFLRMEHKGIWEIAPTPEKVVEALKNYQGWLEDPRSIALI